jgi:hypothetical protein
MIGLMVESAIANVKCRLACIANNDKISALHRAGCTIRAVPDEEAKRHCENTCFCRQWRLFYVVVPSRGHGGTRRLVPGDTIEPFDYCNVQFGWRRFKQQMLIVIDLSVTEVGFIINQLQNAYMHVHVHARTHT